MMNEIQGLKGEELRGAFKRIVGKSTKSHDRQWMLKTIEQCLHNATAPSATETGAAGNGADHSPDAPAADGAATVSADPPATGKGKKKAAKAAKAPRTPKPQKEPGKTPRAEASAARLPKPGTEIEKKTHGKVVAKCTVLEGGRIKYKNKEYGSISAAASAAAVDLELSPKQGGYIFWGIEKVARRDVDPLESLAHAFDRFAERAKSILDAAGDQAPAVRAAIKERIAALKEMTTAA